MDPETGVLGVSTATPLENHKAIGFLRNAGPDPVENYKATNPALRPIVHRSGSSADPGVTSLIPARSYTFVETDHELMVST